MKKQDYLKIGLLILTVFLSYTAWQAIKGSQQQISFLQMQVNNLQTQLSAVQTSLNQSASEKEWIQDTRFTLDKGASPTDRMIVRGEWTLRELKEGQKVQLYYREIGKEAWAKTVLESSGGLTFYAELTLSPEKRYEYKIAAQGEISTGTKILQIPYKVYGLPEFKHSINMIPQKNSNVMRAEIQFVFAPAPMESMKPDKVQIQLEKDGKAVKNVSLKKISDQEWRGSFEFVPQQREDAYVFIDYKNDVRLKKQIIFGNEGAEIIQGETEVKTND